jgi:hypothetical protein
MISRVNVDLIKLNWWKATEAQTKLDNDKEKTNSEQRKLGCRKKITLKQNYSNINISDNN